MSALFDATTEYIALGSAAMPQSLGTFAAWVKPSWAQSDGVTHVLFDVRNGATSVFHLLKHSSNVFRAGWVSSGNDYRIDAAAGSYTLTQNAWNSIVYTWDDTLNDDFLYINGTLEASSTASLETWDTSGRTKYLGNYDAASLDWRGEIAEVAIWPRVLTAAERAIFDGRFVPPLVPGGYGDHWWPLVRELGDPWGGSTGSATGATVGSHPPVVYGGRPRVGVPAAPVSPKTPWHLFSGRAA